MRGAIASTAAGLAIGLVGCRSQSAPLPSTEPAPSASAPIAASPPPVRSTSLAPAPRASAAPPSSVPPPAASAPKKGSRLSLDKPQDVATGSYASLGAVGAIVRKRDGELLVAKLGDKVVPIDDDGKAFTRTPSAVVDRDGGSAVYWVAERALKRRKIAPDGGVSPIEDVAKDAEEGYAPSAVHLEGGDAVAFVARRTSKDGERPARLWIEGKGERDLSPSGSGASSVWLVPTKTDLVAVWLDARSALAPIHAAWIDAAAAQPAPKAEGVVWIAPPSELVTSVEAIAAADRVFALVATPKNGSDFGLASVPVVAGAPPANDALWLDYANGLDPAPVAPAHFCDEPYVVVVRPTARPIDAPKAVELAAIDPSGRLAPSLEIARAGRVEHVAAWSSPKGDGFVLYVADGRTMVRRVRCGAKKG